MPSAMVPFFSERLGQSFILKAYRLISDPVTTSNFSAAIEENITLGRILLH